MAETKSKIDDILKILEGETYEEAKSILKDTLTVLGKASRVSPGDEVFEVGERSICSYSCNCGICNE